MEEIKLRPETPADHRAVEELTREAFWNHYVPGCCEHYLAHILREDKAFLPELDFVAEAGGALVGNIMYTMAQITRDDGAETPVLCFGPLSVLPQWQGKGVGSALVRHTLALARTQGHRAVLITGDPDYYRRFGFVPAEQYGIAAADNSYAAALLALELCPGALSGCAGRFLEAPVFSFDESSADAFDRSFPSRALRDGLPSQARFAHLVTLRRPRI